MAKKVTLYNTLSQKKEELSPLGEGKIKMYVCGPTVYDSAHLGHARAAVTFDVIFRFLTHIGYDVTYARNFTDVDDKIIHKATQTGATADEVAEKYIKEYRDDMASIGVKRPTVEPRVTEHMPEIIDLVGRIIDKGYAYTSGGDVFFSVKKFKGYGKLSRRDPDDMLAGTRIDINELKEDPLDFALWKAAKPGKPFWKSPWGDGRPGWHIECSTMSMKYLGESFDIHGGGKDLIFPHHENEIAQSECVTDKQFAKYWIHNGLIQINREKMSKSVGNILNVKDAVATWNKEAIRLFFLSHQYLNPADFSDVTMNEAETALERLYITLKRAGDQQKNGSGGEDPELSGAARAFKEKWIETMCDDFNTADAIGSLFELTRAINRSIDARGWTPSLTEALTEIKHFGGVLGILEYDPSEYLQSIKLQKKAGAISSEEIEGLIEERNAARKEKNWKRADEIRDYLSDKGILLEDKPEGTLWRVKG
ncbi:MAG TPA: cysteine--tRNA ligase [Thermodesulfobacteriota bacterium]|nr:cysteine--tRNA ligase [Thermodesulfobacteriota bacterium]